jgi:hypothetical protein
VHCPLLMLVMSGCKLHHSRVCLSGLLRLEASFASILQCAIPADMVNPTCHPIGDLTEAVTGDNDDDHNDADDVNNDAAAVSVSTSLSSSPS